MELTTSHTPLMIAFSASINLSEAACTAQPFRFASAGCHSHPPSTNVRGREDKEATSSTKEGGGTAQGNGDEVGHGQGGGVAVRGHGRRAPTSAALRRVQRTLAALARGPGGAERSCSARGAARWATLTGGGGGKGGSPNARSQRHRNGPGASAGGKSAG
jgi:hypothetical protein